ncbi:MAG TPA: prolipoprotein diacylglyceryl transferase [Anaeromyxobacteraceae bacterium]|nr:prolipoprotein diacylglyceryl transferase [Anaeromyxobacteraceae bacterium]
MFPVLFTLRVSATLAKPLLLAAFLAVALARAWTLRRRLARAGERASFAAALWNDKVMLAVLGGVAAALWAMGVLDEDISLPVHTYGLLVATGFVVAIAVAQREARRSGQDVERVGDLALWLLLSALVGSRLYFIAVNWPDYFGDNAWLSFHGMRVPRVLALWEGGLVFYGGFIASSLTGWWYMRRHGMSFLPHADTLIPSVALGHFFGRLGCFAAGCCWGAVSQAPLPWLVRFPPASLAYQSFASRANATDLLSADRLTTLPVHPTQLYESFGELALFALLVLVVRPNKRFHGQILATWLIGYALLRCAVELFRGDIERGVVAGLAVGQWTSMAILAAGVVVWEIGRRGHTRASHERASAAV